MLTLDNFEREIDPEIVQRGRQYYQSGHVSSLDEEDGVWTALVSGTYDYEVQVETATDGLEAECDCPYEYGPYCKHVVAVLYAIRAETKGGQKKVKAQAESKQTVRKIIENLSREQLVEILLEQIKKDKTLGNDILLRYSQEAPSKATYSRIIAETIRQTQDRDGFLDYQDAIRAGHKVQNILDQAGSLIEQDQAAKAIPILQAVIETMPSALEYADDSNGELMGCIDGAFNLLEEAVESLNDGDKRSLFDYCAQLLVNWQHQGFDYEYALLGLVKELVTTTQERDRLFAVLDQNLSNQRHQHFSEYWQEAIIETKQAVMQRLGEPPEVIHALLLQHAHLNRVRQQLIQLYIDQGQLAAAGKMCLQAIQEYQKDKPGLVRDYRNFLIEIARQEGRPDTLIQLTEEQFLQTHDFQHYDQLKRYVPANEWPAFVQRLIEKITQTKHSYWGGNELLLAEIYVREQMGPKLLELARRYGIEIVNRYQTYLHEHYPDEVCAIYEKKVFDMLRQASSRDVYQEAGRYLRQIMELGQEDRAGEIIELLKAEYPKRKAMIEELKKL